MRDEERPSAPERERQVRDEETIINELVSSLPFEEQARRILDARAALRNDLRALSRRHQDIAFTSIQTIATALLGVSITFRSHLPVEPERPYLLEVAWVALAISILLGITARILMSTFYQQVERPARTPAERLAPPCAAGAVASFACAIWSFVFFALANFP